MRLFLTLAAAAPLLVARSASACTCPMITSQQEANRSGERVYRDAGLVVDATVGDVSAAYRSFCREAPFTPPPVAIGRKMDGDRALRVHRVLKGRAPARAVLKGQTAELFAQGCGVVSSSCDVTSRANTRAVLVLHRLPDGRFDNADPCALVALSNSTRGRKLFGDD